MRPGFRQSLTWLHNWGGLVTGWLLLVICAAGTLSVFRRELDAWTHPELTPGPVDQAEAGAAAARWLTAHAPASPSWFLELADDRFPGTLGYWQEGGAFVMRTLSAVTGSPDGIRDSRGGEFFFRLHFDLQIPYPWGRLLAATAAEALLVVLLTGIVAHRRIFKDFFTFRAAKGQRSWLDGHAVLGVLALPFHLMIAFTGAVTLLTLFLPWPGPAAYHGDRAAMMRDLSPEVERPRADHPAPLRPLGPMLRQAERRFGGAGLATVAVANPGDAAAVVTVTAANATGIAVQQHSIAFDGVTGRVLGEFVERRPARRVYDVLYGLHVGRFATLDTRWLYFLSGTMLTATIATGLILWTAKPRRPHGRGYRLVQRLNAGFIAGMPAAFAGFLLANRLLPADLAGRAQWEVWTLGIIWVGTLLAAAILPIRLGWIALLALAATACCVAALLGVARPAIFHSGIASGVEAVLLGFAALFAGAGLMLVRRSRTA